MYIYRIVLDAYDSRSNARSARVVLFVRGIDQKRAQQQIRMVGIDSDGKAYPDLTRDNGWVGTLNMPPGAFKPRSLPEYTTVSIRSVRAAGRSRLLWEYAKSLTSESAFRLTMQS